MDEEELLNGTVTRFFYERTNPLMNSRHNFSIFHIKSCSTRQAREEALRASSQSELGKVLFKILPTGRAPPNVEKTFPNSDFDEICRKSFVYHCDDPLQISR